MRITLITFYGKGGMLSVTQALANELSKKDTVSVIIPKGVPLSGFSKKVKVVAVDVPESYSLKNLLKLPYMVTKLSSVIRSIDETQPDVMHFINNSPWFKAILPFLKKYPKAMILHNPKPHIGESQIRHEFGYKALAKECDRIIVYGKFLKRLALKQGYPAGKLRVTRLGALSNLIKYAGKGVKEKNQILFFGRVEEYKGIKYLARAMDHVKSDVKLVVAGKGKAVLGKNEHVERINRYVSDKEAAKMFQESKVVVLPYIEAMQSAVVPIAYSFNKPVIATNIDTFPEVVENGKTGILVKPKNAKELAKAIDKLISNDKLRKKMGSAGNAKMKKEMNWTKVAEETRKVYKEIIKVKKK